jgi:hypothetical protein
VILLLVGLTRAFRQPQAYRGKILGGILAGVSVLALVFFCVGIFVLGRVPRPETMQKAGDKAPEFSLPDQAGHNVSLVDLLAAQTSKASPASRTDQPGAAGPGPKGALLIFYRGYW